MSVRGIRGADELRKKLNGAIDGIHDDLDRALLAAGNVIRSQAQRNVSGRPGLRVKTAGGLRSRIVAVLAGPRRVTVGLSLVYAAIHEFGGTILPRRGKWLRFKTDDGEWHTVARVDMPARPYLRPAYHKSLPAVLRIVRQVYAGPLKLGRILGRG